MLLSLKSHTNTVWCVGRNPPTITVNDDSVCNPPMHAKMTSKFDMSLTQRSTMSRIPKISNSQSRHIRSTLTPVPRGEFTYNGFSKVSISKLKLFSHYVVINMNTMHPNLNNTLIKKCESRNVPCISDCFVSSVNSTTT